MSWIRNEQRYWGGYLTCAVADQLDFDRLLDKIAKDIMVCENKTIRRWDGSIGSYKNHLRKKMVTMGQV